MESPKQLFERTYEIVVIIALLVLTIINTSLYIGYKKQYNEKISNKEKYEEKLISLRETNKNNEEELNKIKEEYQNIDEVIKNLKEQYFKNAKELETKILNGESDKKIVYLTFDDGPYFNTTDMVLDILKEKGVLATFFILQKNNEGLIPIYEREYYEGHTLANHTASHKISKIYTSVDTFISDVKQQENFLSNRFNGYKTNIVRFPGGSPTAGSLKQGIKSKLYDMGYGYVDWDLETGDGNGGDKNNSDVAYNNVFKNLKDKKVVVVLMHDYSRVTVKALPNIIDEFKNRGFIFLPLFHDSVKVIKN